MTSPFSSSEFCLAFWSPGPQEMILILVVALLLYGGKLPDVARTWGKTFAEFRRNLSGIKSEINDVIYNDPAQLPYYDEELLPEDYNQPTDSEEGNSETRRDEEHQD